MNHKEKVAKRKSLFSLKTYLLKKAQKRLAKLQSRAEKREKTAAETHEHEHEHEHSHEHEHEHDARELFVEGPASDLAKLYDELSEVGK